MTMVFNNIFGFAEDSAALFSVKPGNTDSRRAADTDFEDVAEGAYDDKSADLFINDLHGASSRAKVVREQSPEARVIMGILGSFIQTTKNSAQTEKDSAHAGTVSGTASAGMAKAKETVKEEDGLQKHGGLQSDPDRAAYAKTPEAPKTPKAAEPAEPPSATAKAPQRLGETKKTETTTEGPSSSP
ncbi:hypothetical protein [Streptomyces sp. NPDC023327]|uniref:hypothetical protein n=1 Tax=Streptomyces sp. NPDC023327 TaxID=3157088 RepID=UPI0033DE24A9